MNTDKRAHPWPENGKWIEFRFRKAVWALVRPWYGYKNIFIPLTAVKWMTPIRFWFPFLTYNIKIKGYGIHGYIGWKPITLGDPGFYWRELDQVEKWRDEGRLFVQLSCRGGLGEIS